MLLRGFEMRKRSQGSETFLHLNAEKTKVMQREGESERVGRGRAVIWVNLAAIHIWLYLQVGGKRGIQMELCGSSSSCRKFCCWKKCCMCPLILNIS